jgi:hypothetical protein
MWTSDRRLYRDAEGNVVEATDPSKQSLLVGKGGTLPLDQARELGLVDEPEAETEEKAKAPKSNKAKAPTANKER